MDKFGSLVVGLGLVFLLLYVVGNGREATRKALAQAMDTYHAFLSDLKDDPTNADLYQQALDAGRTYSNMTRQNKGVTLYDEVALSNDLNAATAGATHATPASATVPFPLTALERIGQLDALKSQGLVTDQEYADKRAQILQAL